jgi:hypothetical protein
MIKRIMLSVSLLAGFAGVGCASKGEDSGKETTSATNATPPTVTNVTASNANGTYGIGSVISVQITFSEPITVTGSPQISLSTGTPATTAASYASGSGGSTLTFSYSVSSGNSSADLDYSSTSALALNGGTIKSSTGTNATLTLVSPGAAGSLGANKAIVINGTAPGVTNVTASTANGTYVAGQTVSVQVVFGTVVNVAGGTPTLTLSTGSPATTAINYVSGSGTNTLTFTYTVAAGNSNADLDYASTTALALGGATIRDGALNNAILTLPTPGATNSLGANKALVIDAVAPTVTSVTSSTTNGTYDIGQAISIQVVFSEIVNVAGGTPTLTLSTGTPATTAVTYVSGSGSNTLTFTYTIAMGNTAADLDYSSTGALALGGATIRDTALNNATLTLATPGAANSLGANKAIVVSGYSPKALLARSVSAGGNSSWFNAVAYDGSGNTYAVGGQYGTGTYTYGSQSISGTNATMNAVIVKYDSTGTAVWARTISAGTGYSIFYAVTVNSNGKIVAAGEQSGTSTFTYGSQNTTGTSAFSNATLVQYDSGGTVQWARTVSSGTNNSVFQAIYPSVSFGVVTVVGYQKGAGSYQYGAQTIAGTGGDNAIIIRYNDLGAAQWARTIGAGTGNSQFTGLVLDDSDNSFAVGYQTGTGTYSYGSQNATGTHTGENALLVKYSSIGTEQWAKTVAAGANNSRFNAVILDSSNNIYSAGYQTGTGAFTYGTQNSTGSHTGTNVALVKYDSTGTAQWARTVAAGGNNSQFNAIARDNSGNIFVAGTQTGNGVFTYGSINASGAFSGGSNVVIARYNATGTALGVAVTNSGASSSTIYGLAAGGGNIYAVGAQNGSGNYTFDTQTAAGTYAGGNNVLFIKYQ